MLVAFICILPERVTVEEVVVLSHVLKSIVHLINPFPPNVYICYRIVKILI